MDMMPLETALPLVASAFGEGSAAVHQRILGSSQGLAALYSLVFHKQAEFRDRADRQGAIIGLDRHPAMNAMDSPWYGWDRKTTALAQQFRKELPWYERALDLVARRERLSSLITAEVLHAFGSPIPALATDAVLTKLADIARLANSKHLDPSGRPHPGAGPPTKPNSHRSAPSTSAARGDAQPKLRLTKLSLAQVAIEKLVKEHGTEVLDWNLKVLTAAVRKTGVDCQQGTVFKTTWWREDRPRLRRENEAAQRDHSRPVKE